jgi:hypothetical protein
MKEVNIKGIVWLIDWENKQLIEKDNPKHIRKLKGDDEIDHFRSIVGDNINVI